MIKTIEAVRVTTMRYNHEQSQLENNISIDYVPTQHQLTDILRDSNKLFYIIELKLHVHAFSSCMHTRAIFYA